MNSLYVPAAPGVRLVFLGRLEDVAGASGIEVPLAATVEDLLTALEPALAAALREPRVKRAVNGVLLRDSDASIPLKAGDEVAFLPPVSGG